MTSMTIFAPNQNLFYFVVDSQKFKQYPYKSVILNVKIRTTSILAKSVRRWILTLSKHGH